MPDVLRGGVTMANQTKRNRARIEAPTARPSAPSLIGNISLDETPLDTRPLPGALVTTQHRARAFERGKGIIAPLGTPPDRVIQVRGSQMLVHHKGATQVMHEPLVGPAVYFSKAQFMDMLKSTIQRFESREATAKALHVTARTIFKWQKGIGPSAPRMERVYKQLQKLETITVFK